MGKEEVAKRMKNHMLPYLNKVFDVNDETALAKQETELAQLQGDAASVFAEVISNPKFGGAKNDMTKCVQDLAAISSHMAFAQAEIEKFQQKVTASERQLVVVADIMASADADADEWRQFQDKEIRRLENERSSATSEMSTCKDNEQRWTWFNWGSNASRDMYTRDIALMARRIGSLDGQIKDIKKQISTIQQSKKRDTDRKEILLTTREKQNEEIENARRQIQNLQGELVTSDQDLPEPVEETLKEAKLSTLKAMYDKKVKELNHLVETSGGDVPHLDRMQGIIKGMQAVAFRAELQLKLNHQTPAWKAMQQSVMMTLAEMNHSTVIPSIILNQIKRIGLQTNTYTTTKLAKYLGNVNVTALSKITSGEDRLKLEAEEKKALEN